ncbi:cytochrome p450 domain-containing protein [Hirsutella rhossiliensis]|uniref:Cytochrome p450 domain-containing protein n=1 Tax=Hirsutella rhossiliensis TaxID=111463 RepID=A0A9P8N4N9_9HYPO|nr:cytochrome p450 domain-containing protein [Hirsutella rhossiliensis]KAH0964587.1 cytochrome p450 domain-containing protein [Hirsutella rhossiliensis]
MNERFFWIQELPNLNSFCSKFGIRLYPLLADKAQSEIRSWNKKLCEKAYTTIPSSSHEFCQPANESVLFNAFRTGLQREATKEGSALYGLPLSGQKSILACEVLDTILGGHESMAFAFTHLVWRLTQFPKVQDQLREELLAMKVGDKCDNTLGTAKALDSLPILHSVVMETLRVDAPNPGPQLRETAYPSCKIGKYEIPGGINDDNDGCRGKHGPNATFVIKKAAHNRCDYITKGYYREDLDASGVSPDREDVDIWEYKLFQ